MVGFVPHELRDINGIEIEEVLFFDGNHDFSVSFKLVFKNGKRSDPFALHQLGGIRTTTDAQGLDTTLRDIVYGKVTTIKWLDALYDRVGLWLSEGSCLLGSYLSDARIKDLSGRKAGKKWKTSR